LRVSGIIGALNVALFPAGTGSSVADGGTGGTAHDGAARIAHGGAKARADRRSDNRAGCDAVIGSFDAAGDTVACIVFAGIFVGVERLKRFALWRHGGEGRPERLGYATAQQQNRCEGKKPGVNSTHRNFPV
jgi:hypothetical protein